MYSWADAINDVIVDNEFYLLIGGSPTGNPPSNTLFFASRKLYQNWEWICADNLLIACDKADPFTMMNYGKVAKAIRKAINIPKITNAAKNGAVRIEFNSQEFENSNLN